MLELDVLITAAATAIISSIVGACVSAVVVAIRATRGEREEISRRQDALEDGMRCLLRQNIIDAYHDHVISGEPMTVDQQQQLDRVHSAYKALGGNNLGDKLYNAVREQASIALRNGATETEEPRDKWPLQGKTAKR